MSHFFARCAENTRTCENCTRKSATKSDTSGHCLPGPYSRRLFQKAIEGFDWRINGRALEQRSATALAGLISKPSTGVSYSEAIAAGSIWFALQRNQATLEILTHFLMICKF